MNTVYNTDPYYNTFKTEIMRQHQMIVEDVCHITDYSTSNEIIPFSTMRNVVVRAITELMKNETIMYVYTLDETDKLSENLYNNDRLNNAEYYYTRREKI